MQQGCVELLALALYAPVIVLIHELGHALAARPGGYRLTSFGIGLGTPLWSIYLRSGVVLHLDRWLLAGGAATAIPTGPVTARRAWFHSGGLLAQAALGLALGVLPDPWPLDRLAQFNLLVAITNALPWRWGGQSSDGWLLLDTLTGGRGGSSVLHQRRGLARMARREASVGSPLGRVYSEVCLAWADVLAGRPEAAEALLRDEPPEATLEPWVDALYHYVCSEHHRTAGRPLEALLVARRARSFDRMADEGIALLSVAEARALVDLGATEQATSALARLAGIGGAVGAQAAVVLLWASLASDQPDDVELATWRLHRHAPGPWLDPADAILALRRSAQRLQQLGRPRAAAGAVQAADGLEHRALTALAEGDRSPFRARLASSDPCPPRSIRT
ncbi:MAG TPA: RIP metalloprotease [Deltaproteobacteria bacterium]|nr:RIP metalloprotease [Deltaproteobacteria bacterium]